MYDDSKPCVVRGAKVDLGPARSLGTSAPDGTIDERTCTNPECPTNRRESEASERP